MMDNDELAKRLKIKKLRGRPRKVMKFSLHPQQMEFLKKFGMVVEGGYLLYIQGHGLLAKAE